MSQYELVIRSEATFGRISLILWFSGKRQQKQTSKQTNKQNKAILVNPVFTRLLDRIGEGVFGQFLGISWQPALAFAKPPFFHTRNSPGTLNNQFFNGWKW